MFISMAILLEKRMIKKREKREEMKKRKKEFSVIGLYVLTF